MDFKRYREDPKDEKILILNTDLWAAWEANPMEREEIKLLARKQGKTIIRFKNKDLWRKDGGL